MASFSWSRLTLTLRTYTAVEVYWMTSWWDEETCSSRWWQKSGIQRQMNLMSLPSDRQTDEKGIQTGLFSWLIVLISYMYLLFLLLSWHSSLRFASTLEEFTDCRWEIEEPLISYSLSPLFSPDAKTKTQRKKKEKAQSRIYMWSNENKDYPHWPQYFEECSFLFSLVLQRIMLMLVALVTRSSMMAGSKGNGRPK
jgi:hypothetical protein